MVELSSGPSFSAWRPHPWHGLAVGREPPRRVNAYIELTPYDLVKYEIDKETGYLRVDRPQRTSSQAPALYGFIPRTYAGRRVSALMSGTREGDGDPLDICVLCERPITRPEILLEARVIGGIPMSDGGQADDKILGVLESDQFWAGVDEIAHLPRALIERILHYFATYKLGPDAKTPVALGTPYDRNHAETVIRSAMEDYAERFSA